MPSRFPCVEAFLTAIYELLPSEREEALGEVTEFYRGYVGCKEEMWREMLGVKLPRTRQGKEDA